MLVEQQVFTTADRRGFFAAENLGAAGSSTPSSTSSATVLPGLKVGFS